jgi:hypothetical protein
MRAREIRGDFSFGEEILDIADITADDAAVSGISAYETDWPS